MEMGIVAVVITIIIIILSLSLSLSLSHFMVREPSWWHPRQTAHH